ncbi:MAG TPA: hypothetical protein VHB21_08695, partial [Minicystis sp.]|nr:hypothetical protein [Minicystis sp.]
RLCRDIGAGFVPEGLDPPSPLREADSPPWEAPAEAEPTGAAAWGLDDVARLEADVRPALTIDGQQRFVGLLRGRAYERLPPIDAPWAGRLVMRLGESPAGLTPMALAAAFAAPVDAVAGFLEVLRRRGLVRRIRPGEA